MVDSEFSVLLWSKALVLDLNQAEQNQHSMFLHFTGSNCIEDNVAMPGNDIVENSPEENIKTKEDCCTACKNKEGCTFFTYRKEKEKCWLKNSDAGRKVDEEAVSGSVDCCKGNT